MICHKCGKDTGFSEFVGRGDSCPHCRFDAKVCKNCEFYDLKAYNECHETSAERVIDKEKANFCDFFQGRKKGTGGLPKLDPKAAADALFKKK